ncbi:MAG: hypothetical protein U9R20_04580 [Thermodesulfobacteriota bacterium]|nr:hypothetical protein [Thermodesulfobacteriota bacterium]
MTRVAGYFSRVSSWNKGKLAELRDRKRQGRAFGSSKEDAKKWTQQ